MPIVALDTNALMMPVELDVRVFDELDRLFGDPDLVAPWAVLRELDRLSGAAGEAATAASVGRDLAERRCRTVDAEPEDADDALLALGRAGAVDYVVTNDRPLRDRLLAAAVPVVGVRDRNTLAITEP
ncbi:MAG: PIN domain-containing protein [Halobacteriales archaeon]